MPARAPRGLRASASALAALAALVALASGCESGTGGREVRFEFALASAPSAGRPLGASTTSTGWEVTLDEACMALGPAYLFENAPLLAPVASAPRRKSPLRWLERLVPPAHAHAGDAHFDGGQVRGEWVEQVVFDALDPAGRAFPDARGLAGPARSFTLLLDPPRPSLGNAAACLRGHHAYAVGVATRGEQSVPFEGGLDLEAGVQRRLDGAPLDAALDDGVRVALELHLSAWFDQAHFDRLTEFAPSGRYLVTPSSQVGAAWRLGARGATTFTGATEGHR